MAARQVRTFVPPPKSERPDTPVRTLYLDPPSVSGSAAISAAPQLPSVEQTRLPNPPPASPPPQEAKPKPAAAPPPEQPAPAPARAAESKRVDATYTPPRPVRRVPPTLQSQVLRMMITSETRVEVVAQVDASGRVTGAQVVSGVVHKLLIGAITDAARKWVFEPARLDGKPVSSEARIVFVLTSPRDSGAK
jgi:TonB family protein